MRYADTLLVEGEEIALRTRQHWLAVLGGARHGLALWALAVALVVGALALDLTARRPWAEIIGLSALALFAVGLVIVLIQLWQWWAQDYLITNRRLMKVWGVFNKRSVDSALEKVNDAQLDQSLLGRIFNYGHLDILTASTETDLDDYDMIRDPKGFKRMMLTQKHALEQMYYRGAPSPPLRAPMDMNGEPINRPAPAADDRQPQAASAGSTAAPNPTTGSPSPAPSPAPPAPPSSESADRSLEITRAIARLADLRDRGAVDEHEFQAKKKELLDRL